MTYCFVRFGSLSLNPRKIESVRAVEEGDILITMRRGNTHQLRETVEHVTDAIQSALRGEPFEDAADGVSEIAGGERESSSQTWHEIERSFEAIESYALIGAADSAAEMYEYDLQNWKRIWAACRVRRSTELSVDTAAWEKALKPRLAPELHKERRGLLMSQEVADDFADMGFHKERACEVELAQARELELAAGNMES